MKIAIGIDRSTLWHEKFVSALERKIAAGWKAEYQVISLEDHDWIAKVEPFDLVIWKSDYMGAQSSTNFKEKIYFIERYLGKRVFPNYSTVWHFESKIAQSYLFELFSINTPPTVASFNYDNALLQLQQARMPLVVKLSHGAGSSNVSLVGNRATVSKSLTKIFCHQLWKVEQRKYGNTARLFLQSLGEGWFWHKALQTLLKRDKFRSIYWQEFVAGNDGDLRVTVIGGRFAYAFWRKNRPNDFRASGSGRIDFESDAPREVVEYCIEVSRRLNFDSMAYDILFTDGGFVIIEISYTYLDSAPYNSKGYFEQKGDELLFYPGHFWPQELWIEAAVSGAALARQGGDDVHR